MQVIQSQFRVSTEAADTTNARQTSIGAATIRFIAALNTYAEATGGVNDAILQQVLAMGELTNTFVDKVNYVQTQFPLCTRDTQDSESLRQNRLVD